MKKLIYNLLFLVGIASVMSSCGYNSMVEKETAIEGQWAQVENVYQRRADLIPNLVETVKGSAEFQKSTYTAVTEARAKAKSVNLDVKDLTPENLAKFQAVQDEFGNAINKMKQGLPSAIDITVEKYPDLDVEAYKTFMSQLEGTENRITVERRRFNEVVQDYNAYIRKFPNNMTAGMFGFEKKGYFSAKPGADVAPSVKF